MRGCSAEQHAVAFGTRCLPDSTTGSLQLELFANEQLASNWRTLAKREAKAAARNAAHVPAAQRPEVQFLPGMLKEFLEVSSCSYRAGSSAPLSHTALPCTGALRAICLCVTCLLAWSAAQTKLCRGALGCKPLLVSMWRSALQYW